MEHDYLTVTLGSSCQQGLKDRNEDAVCYRVPQEQHQLKNKGVAVCLADGVSSAEAGQFASNYATHEFISNYYDTPDTWSANHAGAKVLTTINLNLFKRSHEFIQQEKGYLCTFDSIIIKSRTLHFFHVGDSRIYLLRDGELKQLTRDHTVSISKGKNILSRAVGMDNNIQIDYANQALQTGDIIFLSSDGVHDFIQQQQLIDALTNSTDLQQTAEDLVELALVQRSDDNCSCIIAKIDKLPHESINDLSNKLTRLPFPPSLEPGMKLDGYRIEKEIFASSRSQLYLVIDEETKQKLVMKTPSINFEDDVSYIDRFIQEEWIGKRIDSPYVVKVIAQPRERNFLYYLMEYVEGTSLEHWMKENPFPKPKVAIQIIEQVAKGLKDIHAKESIHQDLKPGNIMLQPDGAIKIVDFGSTFVAGIAEVFSALQHEGALGTASYSDPLYLMGKNPGVQGDIYALATITYELFTGKLPYGARIEECRTPLDYDRLRYVPASKINPVVPIWFDKALEFGVKFDLEHRYHSLDKFIHDLKHPNPDYLTDAAVGKSSANQVVFWQMMSGFWFIMFLLAVVIAAQ